MPNNNTEVVEPMLGLAEKGLLPPIAPIPQPQETEKKNQYIAAISVSLGAVCAGTVLAWTSPVLPQLAIVATNATNATNASLAVETAGVSNVSVTLAGNASTDAVNSTLHDYGFQLTESEGSLVGSMLAIGALCAALPAGYVADKFGRRKANLFLTIPFLLNWILIVFAKSALMLYVARFFSGIATGALCVTAPMYIGEIAEVAIRGTLGSFFQMCVCFGIFLTCFVGSLTDWIGLSWILMVVPLLFAVAMYFMPDTPVYLAKIGDTSAAEKSLKFLRGQKYNPDLELKIIQADLAKSEEKSAGLKDLVASKGNKKALISALCLMVFQQLSGINAVIFYTVPIFKSAGSSLSPSIAAIIVSIVQFIIAYVAAMIIDKANRRFYLKLSAGGMMICLAALGMYFHMQNNNFSFAGIGILPLGSLVLFIVSFSLGFGPIPWMIMSELFAPEIKGVASGLAVVTNWLLVFVVTFSFPLMNSNLGGHVTFYFFAIVMGAATAFVHYYVPETKGKTLQEIQAILNK